MRELLLAMLLYYNVKQNYDLLKAVEGGFAAFSTVNWIIVVITVLEIPLAIAMTVKGYINMKNGRLEQEEKRREEEEKAREAALVKYTETPAEEDAGIPENSEETLWTSEEETEETAENGSFNQYDD